METMLLESSRNESKEDGVGLLVKGKANWRNYRYLELQSNGVNVMLVQDSKSLSVGAACCVNVGAGSDPWCMPGIAHLTEHLCFMGSEKYPQENGFKQYLTRHGGRSNGSTSLQTTTYQMDILAEHIEPALDRMAHFFIHPTFASLSQEVNAVDAENSKNQTNDGRRRLQVLKAICDPHHTYAKFTTGNLETLPPSKAKDLIPAFHERHYTTPSNLTLVLVGPQSLDELQQLAVQTFGTIPPKKDQQTNQQQRNLTSAQTLIQEAALQAPKYGYRDNANPIYNSSFPSKKLIVTIPPIVHSKRHLALLFPMPPKQKETSHIISMMSHLLGHEGPGSSFALLQKKLTWIHSLSAGLRIDAPDQAVFQIQVQLTEQGEENWKDVVTILQSHCRLLSSTDNDLQYLWKEKAQLDQIQFDTASPGTAYNYAPSLARRILQYGPNDCLTAGYFLDTSDDATRDQLLYKTAQSYLTPHNCIIERCSTKFWEEIESTDKKSEIQVEPHYKIDYHVQDFTPKLLEQFEQDVITLSSSLSAKNENEMNVCNYLYLPKPNLYIPTNLDLCSDLPPEATLGPRIDKDLDPPNLIINDEEKGRRLWHRVDDRYALPRSSMTILLVNPNVSYSHKQGWEYSLEQSVKSSMLTNIFNRAMAQETYDADLAGLEWYLFDSSSGIQLTVHGYSNKLSQFALDLLKKFLLVENNHSAEHFCTESFFKITKERSINNCESFFQSKRADTYASYYRDMILSSRSDGIEERKNITQNMTLESLKDHHQKLTSTMSQIQCFYTGNVSKSEAEDFFHQATSIVEKNITPTNSNVNFVNNYWLQDSHARFLPPGEDIDIHFTSQNPKEENGAVLVTYQSNTPAYRGDLSASASPCLKQSASLKLLCHMLREPLFNELRTKQQLGYIVTSYYDMKLSSAGPPPLQNEKILNQTTQNKYTPWTFPIESIVVKVMSKAQDPPTVLQKVDEFIEGFRDVLINMPESKIHDHIDALSKTLLKPIQNLEGETGYHLNTIMNYGPEFLSQNDAPAVENIPWNRKKLLADTIQTLERSDLLQVWDRFVVNKKERSRIVSCVYGSKFPIQPNYKGIPKQQPQSIVNNFPNLLSLRSKLEQYTPESSKKCKVKSNNAIILSDLIRKMKNPSFTTIGVAAMTIGAGILIGSSLSKRYKTSNLK